MLNSGCSKECQCNEFGSLNVSCDPIMGQCYCKDNIVGLLCSKAADGFYYRVLDDIKFEAEEAELSPVTLLYVAQFPCYCIVHRWSVLLYQSQ